MRREKIFNRVPVGAFWLVLGIFILELLCQIFGVQLRSTLLLYLAFFPLNTGLDHSLYPGQVYLSFFSYSFLHISFLHMALNMSIVLALGKNIEQEIGYIGLIALFLSSAILGAIFFLLFPASQHLPMLGASGSAFGFIGYWKGKEMVFRAKKNLPLKPVIIFLLGLTFANFLLVYFFPFPVAWQAHLGGFLCGMLIAFIHHYLRLYFN